LHLLVDSAFISVQKNIQKKY
jgi:hypothetical protein